MNKESLFWQTYLNLEDNVIELSKYIFFADKVNIRNKDEVSETNCENQLCTFSPYIADLIVQISVQIESISKELFYRYNKSCVIESSNLKFDADCLAYLDDNFQISKKIVYVVNSSFNLKNKSNNAIYPLKNARQSKKPQWKDAYQALKHDRFGYINKGNVRNCLMALAALYLLNIYFRNDLTQTTFHLSSSLDFSRGSKIFMVKAPVLDFFQLNSRKNIHGDIESPFIATIDDNYFERLDYFRKIDNENINDFLLKQPEINENDFQKQLLDALELSKKDKTKTFMPLWELGKYRLWKKVPKDLPFDKRKELFINTSEWNGILWNKNKHLNPEELNENNIQREIDRAGILSGWELMWPFEKHKEVESNIENVKLNIELQRCSNT